MFSVVGVRAPVQEPDRRAILRLAHHLSESTLLYRNFKEKPQQTKVSSDGRAAMERSGPQTGPQMNSSNELLPPRYRDPTRIGYGGMGEIFRAEDSELGRVVAIKVLAERYARDPSLRQRFTREALAAARLSGDRAENGHDLRRRRVGGAARSSSWSTWTAARSRTGCVRGRLRPTRPSTGSTQAAAALDAAHAQGRRPPRREAGQPAADRRRQPAGRRFRDRERRRTPVADDDRDRARHGRLPLAGAGAGRARRLRRATATRWRSSRSSSSPGGGRSSRTARRPRRRRTSTPRCRRSPAARPGLPARDWRRIPRRATRARPSSSRRCGRRSRAARRRRACFRWLRAARRGCSSRGLVRRGAARRSRSRRAVGRPRRRFHRSGDDRTGHAAPQPPPPPRTAASTAAAAATATAAPAPAATAASAC